MTKLTMPLYYYDKNGYKIDPVNKKELYALAENGTITPETRLTDEKIEFQAKNIPKLKFHTPEYNRTKELEELFDIKNIDFNYMPPQSNSETQQTFTATPAQNVTTQPHQQVAAQPTSKNIITPQHADYKYFQIVLQIYYPLAAIIFYSGLTFTTIATLICLFVLWPLTPVILISGIILTICPALTFGFFADYVQYMINTEEHLKEIKDRLN